MGGLARAKAPIDDSTSSDYARHVITLKKHGHRMDARDGVRGHDMGRWEDGGRARTAILEDRVRL